MDQINLGHMKPQQLDQAAEMKAAGNSHLAASKRANAMSRHPASAGRSAEFHAQAQAHLGEAQSMRSAVRSMPSDYAGSFTPNSSNMSSRSRSALN